MIYVAVGTQKFQFNRLLRTIDMLIENGSIEDEVFAQIGHSDYLPTNYKYVDFLSKEKFDTYVKNCDLLITHSGVSTIITGLKYEKRVIVVPRLSKFNEHVDDHQMQIAESFMKQNLVVMHREGEDFAKTLTRVKEYEFSKYVSQREVVIDIINNYLNREVLF